MIIIYILIGIITFLFMEGVAWFTHKYVMHGFLWIWHKSHHKVHPYALELNDLFAVVFSIPSVFFISSGLDNPTYRWMLAVGMGIFAYGIFYFVFHDIIVHRRIKIPFKASNSYLKRIIKAHYVHHEIHTKKGARSFGFLYASKDYDQN